MVLGISASSQPGGVTPHSARKVQKMPASGISSELRAHQMAPGGVVAHSSPPAESSRRQSRVCTRFFDRGFFVWCCASVPRRLWYRYWDARMRGVKHRCWSDIRSGETSPTSSLCSSSSSPALRAQTRPAMGVRLWRGGSASTVALFLFFTFLEYTFTDALVGLLKLAVNV